LINFDDFVEQVRDANPIEEVIREGGLHLKGHGRLLTCTKHDSLKVRTDMQRAWWYSQNWSGDVFGWIMKEKGTDFNQTLEKLAVRAKIDMPRFDKVNESEVQRSRATTDAFSVAAAVFQRWLLGYEQKDMKADKDVLAYCEARGWTDETTRLALSGFSGRKQAWQVKDMIGDFNLYGIDIKSPAAVAVLGFEGDVDAWAREQGVREDEDFDNGWIEKKRIHGLMDVPGLIYAHQHKGGVKYLSRRNLPGFDKIKSEGKTRDWKSFNPYKLLAGHKQVYFNHVHRVDRPLVMVEGQGDAKTWGQWGHGAMAWCGLLGDVSQMAVEDAERLRKQAAYIKKHPALYLAMDDDEAGQAVLPLAAKLLGPKIQIVRMTKPKSQDDADENIEDDNAEE